MFRELTCEQVHIQTTDEAIDDLLTLISVMAKEKKKGKSQLPPMLHRERHIPLDYR